MNRLAPVIIEEGGAVEAHKLVEQATINAVGCGRDGEEGSAHEFRKLAHAESEFADSAKASTSAAFERPEDIGVGAGVGNANLSVGGDDFGFEQTGRGGTVVLGEAAEAAALNEARHSYRGASATLNISTRFG